MTHERPVSYAVPSEKSSPKFASAFAAGCKGHATNENTLLPGPVALFGSPARRDLLTQAIAEGRTWYYADHALFRRHQQFRITKNAYQHDGRGDYPPDRFQQLRVNTHPTWQTGGTSIVICPNSRAYMAWFGIDAEQWVLDCARTIGRLTDRPIIIRWKTQAQHRPIYVDLHQAWMTVVFSSACAIDSLMAGVPVCTLAPWASTARMGIQDLSQVNVPYYPDIEERDRFFWALAYQQWTLDEIREGVAWRALT